MKLLLLLMLNKKLLANVETLQCNVSAYLDS